jgi:uncharacterized protein YllA (UPF0747 family)
VTANVSSSSVGSLPDALRVGLAAAGLLPALPRAFLGGSDVDLLAPLRFLPAAQLPAVSALAAASGRTAAGGRTRAELASALLASNRAYGHPNADHACRRLADPATRVVATGQQPGLFGGPLLTFAKMMAAARWAAALEAAGEPAVAVFWVATEDHDFAEVASATVLTADGPRTFDLGADTQPLVPVGMRALSPAVNEVLRGMGEALPGEGHAEWLRTLARWYRPESRIGEAFCRVAAAMLGPHCPLLLDAMHPALKAAERPWLARLIERRGELADSLARQEAAVAGRGYELRVTPQPGASPLFLLRHGQRRRIEWRDSADYALRGETGADAGPLGRPASPAGGADSADGAGAAGGRGGAAVADLLRILDENPAVVSPGVLARPAIADAVLGTTLQVLGPGELSYMPQAAAVYPLLEIEAPWVALRPQTLVLDAAKAQRLEEAGLTLAELLGERSRLDRALAERSGGDFVAPVRHRLEAALEELRGPALAADPNLERPLAKTREQVLRAIDLFADKAMPALARRDEVQSRRVDALRQTCLPGGKPQERVVNAAYFRGKYGDRLAAGFWEQLDLDPTSLSVILP